MSFRRRVRVGFLSSEHDELRSVSQKAFPTEDIGRAIHHRDSDDFIFFFRKGGLRIGYVACSLGDRVYWT